MITRWQLHGLPKAGAREGESEDAASSPVRGDGSVRVAIADGATESAHAGRWARALVEHAVAMPLEEAITEARKAFRALTAGATGQPWYVEEKLHEGAFAAVLALALREEGTFIAESVGDCVMLHLRNHRVILSWPIDDPAAFDDRPPLVGSSTEASEREVSRTSGEWNSGDVILLVTDALAAHLLKNDPFEAIGLDADGFASFVRRARSEGMRNDDVTLIELHLA